MGGEIKVPHGKEHRQLLSGTKLYASCLQMPRICWLLLRLWTPIGEGEKYRQDAYIHSLSSSSVSKLDCGVQTWQAWEPECTLLNCRAPAHYDPIDVLCSGKGLGRAEYCPVLCQLLLPSDGQLKGQFLIMKCQGVTPDFSSHLKSQS